MIKVDRRVVAEDAGAKDAGVGTGLRVRSSFEYDISAAVALVTGFVYMYP